MVIFNFTQNKDIDKIQVFYEGNLLSEQDNISYKFSENMSLDISFNIFIILPMTKSNSLMMASSLSSICPDYSIYNNYYSYNIFHLGWTNYDLNFTKRPVFISSWVG